MPVWSIILLIVLPVAVGAATFFAGIGYRRKTAEAKIGSAEDEAKRLVNDAMKSAQQKRKEALVEAKDEALQMKTAADQEIKERRNELTRQERRLDQKEEAIDRKTTALEDKETDLRQRGELVEARLAEIDQLRLRQTEKLEAIAALSQADAK
ncbi:MAG: Rnase Y domain-containing protein, partial [Ruthenibacterium sp.]